MALTVPSLSSILAQDPAISVIRSAWASDRLPHAMLFAGPEGVGKGTTARALASLFLCEQPSTSPPDPCGKCPSCLLMNAEAGATHPDYHVVYRQLVRHLKDSVARDLSIEVIRDFLVAPAGRSSQLGRGKVFVVEEAEAMNTAAQNALLKTLEEPQGRTLIILLTPTPGALLPTIRSRCQPVYFSPLPESVILSELTRRGISEPDARDAARLTDGSLGLALRFTTDNLLPLAKSLETRLVSTLTGKPAADTGASGSPMPKFFKDTGDQIAETFLKRDPDGSKDQATREALAFLFRLGADTCRRYLRLARTTTGLEKLCRAIDHLTAAQQHLDANVSISLVLQNLSAQLES